MGQLWPPTGCHRSQRSRRGQLSLRHACCVAPPVAGRPPAGQHGRQAGVACGVLQAGKISLVSGFPTANKTPLPAWVLPSPCQGCRQGFRHLHRRRCASHCCRLHHRHRQPGLLRCSHHRWGGKRRICLRFSEQTVMGVQQARAASASRVRVGQTWRECDAPAWRLSGDSWPLKGRRYAYAKQERGMKWAGNPNLPIALLAPRHAREECWKSLQQLGAAMAAGTRPHRTRRSP